MTEHRHWPTDRESLQQDCVEEHVRVGGPGGQHKNKRATGIRLIHLSSGLVVTATERRSQAQNREVAYARLAGRLDELQRVVRPRRPTRPSRASVQRRLTEKRRRAEKKQGRGRPDE